MTRAGAVFRMLISVTLGTGTSPFSGMIVQFHRAPTHSDAPASRNVQDLAGLLEDSACAWKRAHQKITHQIVLPRLPSRSNSSSCAPGFRDAKLKSSPFSIINLIPFRRPSDTQITGVPWIDFEHASTSLTKKSPLDVDRRPKTKKGTKCQNPAQGT